MHHAVVLIGISAERGRLKLDEPISRTWTGRGQLSHYAQVSRPREPCPPDMAATHQSSGWICARKRRPLAHGHRVPQGDSPLGHHDERPALRQLRPRRARPSDALLQRRLLAAGPGAYLRCVEKDLKQVLQEELFSHLGIPADRWDWLAGQVVHDTRDFYPAFPGYGEYVDPPYEINGHVVRVVRQAGLSSPARIWPASACSSPRVAAGKTSS